MARFFIDRPIFAWVIAIIIMLAGALAMLKLPISMYPEVAPPAVSISANYPGASAKVVEDSVTQIIEQNMKGLDGLIYFSSNSSSNGQASITLTFESGTNPDIAQVQVQNKLQLAMPLLPQEVQRQGINVAKSSSGFLNVIGFVSEDGSMDEHDISDYVGSNVIDPLSRVPGVGSIQVFGGKYAMRIWLDPNKLQTYRVSVDEVTAAVRAQNAQVAVGQLGGAPAVKGQQLNATINAQDRLQTPQQFRDIVLRTETDGSTLKLGDVARVELGAETYDFVTRYNGKPASGLAVTLATGANALATAEGVRTTLDELAANFPHGLKAVIPYDTTPFVKVSIKGVVKTLLEAIVLVFLVMYLFLQNFRATLIPTIAVPVVLLGTFGVLAALGFSINMLTMFAMVLAIGLLVDDAIVVVENVERIMSEEGLSPLEATRKSMGQITGALVGIGLVLSAVFVPMAFMSGSTGVIYRQFSATIVSAMALSVLVAIVLTPALCATMLKPLKKGEHHVAHRGLAGRFFNGFNNGFDRTSGTYQRGVRGILARPWRFMAVFAALAVAMGVLFMRLPSSFLPNEDQGILMALVQAPVGATQERTLESIYKLEDHFLQNEKDAVESVFSVQGFSFSGMGQNSGMAFVKLKDWHERTPDQGVGPITGRAMAALGQIKDAFIFAFPPPAMPELGTASGYTFFLKDNTGQGHDALVNARNQLLGMAGSSDKLANVRPNGLDDTPQLRLDIDVAKAGAHGLSLDAINSTLATAWGSSYVDDFIDRGRVKRVYMQADDGFRMNPEDFNLWTVKNSAGQMVPFSAFASQRWDYGSPRLERYNGVSALEIQGEAAPGVASGDAMAEVEKLASQLPPGFSIEWTAVSYQEREAGSQTPLLYTLSLLIVFLCLAALYESWSVPTAVLLVAPLGILGAVLANTFRGMERDVYFQVAMLTTVGLTSKNAILIVEFAKEHLEKGAGVIEATMHAVRDRLRPIVMTSLAFGLGVLPLAIASGAGSGAQRAIGTGVLGGMIAGTVLGLFFIPLFFVVVQRLFNRRRLAANGEPPQA
ncbi:MAG: multidrug efflux RND transporter permease [Lysobacteraceae bacterium SCN 69-123]|uniref:multidrug efflux RND transporter permease subunit SmeE n=1 Tax=Stenotrophomonas acidaminiphila TaxID=128780 RepID=UPI00086EBF6D|nr:multidrug efflux RND transporter permease subunit SmeE [Stenotrophomonas acidaminiphila]MBN8803205.1 multidrug efflux RND transporter permease subunit SmeE [Stenotrophomonas acidaminiphila]MDF9441681.1 multidrug efflux RND transporter permease subunit SmeE [Stenotrophomonas acidaminiphila]ODU42220.1 MAG: multidrug efflux RND transporter permease [Xanthomonadaceae bacterium SCN 69-123]OJY78746.1 MAG: multidrug efflux RND transporter permease [Stenotrophomonas sp. 69-14]